MRIKTLLATTILLIGSLLLAPQADASVFIDCKCASGKQIVFDDLSLVYARAGDLVRGAVWVYENGIPKLVNFQYFKAPNNLRVKVDNGDWKYVNRYTDDESIEYVYGSLIALKLAEKKIIPTGFPLEKFYKL